jgi:hypothetical protein
MISLPILNVPRKAPQRLAQETPSIPVSHSHFNEFHTSKSGISDELAHMDESTLATLLETMLVRLL